MKIPFSIEYKEQIESGEYKVKTKSGQEVRIVCWDMNTCNGTLIVALVKGYGGEYEKMRSYTLDGKCKGASEEASLLIHTPQPELTEFEKVYSKVKYSSELLVVFSDEQLAQFKEEAATLLEYAKRELKEQSPKWKLIDPNLEYQPCLTREIDENGDWHYCISSGKVYDGCQYILLAELEQLKMKEEG